MALVGCLTLHIITSVVILSYLKISMLLAILMTVLTCAFIGDKGLVGVCLNAHLQILMR